MKIGNLYLWCDGWLLRSSNQKTNEQPFEMGICKWWRMPGLKIYEDESERGGTQIRISVECLWLYVNALLWLSNRETRRWDDSCRQWGFYFMDRVNFVWRWGKKYVSFYLPFVTSIFVRREILSVDRRRVVHVCGGRLSDYEASDQVKRANSATFPYVYELLNGSRQTVQATVVIERFIRRRKWTPFKSKEDSIWVTFSEEVGPGRGSWKGGVTGCGWTLKANETAVQCLRRMERDRRFER